MRIPRLAAAALLAALTAARLAAGEFDIPGYRGVAMPVADYELQFLQKGDRIDVLTTFEAVLDESGRKEWVTATLLQNVMILDVKPASPTSHVGSVQLALNPNEGQYLALALKTKKIVTVILRAKGDGEMRPMPMASFSRLFR